MNRKNSTVAVAAEAPTRTMSQPGATHRRNWRLIRAWNTLATVACVASLGIALLSACGCGSGDGIQLVEGIVLLDGEPLEGANVAFSPAVPGAGRPAVGKSRPDGTFTLTIVPHGSIGKGTSRGEYLVTVSKQLVEWPPAPSGWSADDKGGFGSVPRSPKVTDITPARYGNIKTSGLTVSVVKGRNQPRLELSSK